MLLHGWPTPSPHGPRKDTHAGRIPVAQRASRRRHRPATGRKGGLLPRPRRRRPRVVGVRPPAALWPQALRPPRHGGSTVARRPPVPRLRRPDRRGIRAVLLLARPVAAV